MQNIVEDLFASDPQKQGNAFAQAIELIVAKKWNQNIGHGCNLFHFIAFAPENALEQVLPDWKERLEKGIKSCKDSSFDKENKASPEPVIKGLIEEGEGVPALNRDTPMGIAIYRGNETAARIFLENGADIYHKNATGNTILHLAAASNSLVDEISQQVVLRAFETSTNRGQTPLEQAKQHQHPKAAQTLSDRYAELKSMVERWANRGNSAGMKR